MKRSHGVEEVRDHRAALPDRHFGFFKRRFRVTHAEHDASFDQ